jgi:hypothetical protein
LLYGSVAQLVEQRPFKPLVLGSSPNTLSFIYPHGLDFFKKSHGDPQIHNLGVFDTNLQFHKTL